MHPRPVMVGESLVLRRVKELLRGGWRRLNETRKYLPRFAQSYSQP